MPLNFKLSGFWSHRLRGCLCLAFLTAGSLGIATPATADVALTRADVESLLNRVEFIPRGRRVRPARLTDFLTLGDALRTAAASRAELRFNDGSLARVGERATFRFIPNTRNFRLSNGTVLLLIPPGQGRSTIQTPNAVTGIQGSALAVRYSEANDTTVIMALTENPDGLITVTNGDDGQEYGLRAGEMALVHQGVVKVYEFDLEHFYKTSSLVEGLGLADPDHESSESDPLSEVRNETLTALEEQGDFTAEAIINPDALSVEEARQTSDNAWIISNSPDNPLTEGITGPNRYSTVTSSGLVTSGPDTGTAVSPPTPAASTPKPAAAATPPAPVRPTSAASPTPAPGPTPTTPIPTTPTPTTPTPADPTPGVANPPVDPNPGSPAEPGVTPNPGGPASPAAGEGAPPITFPDKDGLE